MSELEIQVPDFVDEGLCAFCGALTINAVLMYDIHQEIEEFLKMELGSEGYEDARESLREIICG